MPLEMEGNGDSQEMQALSHDSMQEQDPLGAQTSESTSTRGSDLTEAPYAQLRQPCSTANVSRHKSQKRSHADIALERMVDIAAHRNEILSNRNLIQPQVSIEDRMAIVVERVGAVSGMVLRSPLYWASIDLLAVNEVARGVLYALPDECKLHYLKYKTKESNVAED